MNSSVFFELEFWLLVLFSVVVPFTIYVVLLKRRSVSSYTVLVLGIGLLIVAGLDVYWLQSLGKMAKRSPSEVDDFVFLSELSIGFYLIPALFGGVGVNLVSHVLIRHISKAENKFEENYPDI